MITLASLATFFGWCSAINLGLYAVSALGFLTLRKQLFNIQEKLFGLNATDLEAVYIQQLGNYKVAMFVFSFVPYFALMIMVR